MVQGGDWVRDTVLRQHVAGLGYCVYTLEEGNNVVGFLLPMGAAGSIPQDTCLSLSLLTSLLQTLFLKAGTYTFWKSQEFNSACEVPLFYRCGYI